MHWYSDGVWRRYPDEGRHECGGYYAQHRADNPDIYLPLHDLVSRIPARLPHWQQGLRKGARRW